MLVCFVCGRDVSTSIKILFEHFKAVHHMYANYTRYSCKQGQCCRTFSNKYTFIGHIRREHKNDIYDTTSSESCAASNVWQGEECLNLHSEGEDVTDGELQSSQTVRRTYIDIKHLAAMFISEAKSRVATLSNVQSVVIACQQMFEAVIDDIQEALNEVEKRTECDLQLVYDKLALYRNPFNGLQTEYSQNAYLEDAGVLVKPLTYVIGQSQVFVKDKDTGQKKPIMESFNGQFVSIRETILALHNHSDVIKDCAAYTPGSSDGYYQSYFDGILWKNHPLRDGNVLVLRLYGDDFEPANALGSRKTVYKVGCIYFQFESLPSHVLSRTENMFLTLCYHTADVKTFGWDRVLQPLVMELQSLEANGIDLNFEGTVKRFQVVVGVVTGDNLFLNGILGFVESFTASYPCRHCHLHRDEFQTTFTENVEAVRTVASYDADVDAENVKDTGIKQPCALNKLLYFHAAKNCVQDVMHDVFEGVIGYDLPLLCQWLVSHKYLTTDLLNSRIQNFEYGYADSSNKPPIISSVNVEMFPFDASQMWCLCRVLSLAVGDVVVEDDECWQWYLRLRDIVDIVLAPSVSESCLEALSVLIAEYLQLRKSLFPSHRLKNKHHHLIHYHRLIQAAGPMQRFSCMRLESKHQRSKRLLHISGNYKNVPKSCAIRHQLAVAFRLLKPKQAEEITVGTGMTITLAELSDGHEINRCLGGVGMFFELFNANWIEIKGVKYKPHCTLLIELEPDGHVPVFMILEHIVMRDGKVWFVGEKLQTEDFSVHFHAWNVVRSVDKNIVCMECLCMLYPWPLTLTTVTHHDEVKNMIAFRHRI